MQKDRKETIQSTISSRLATAPRDDYVRYVYGRLVLTTRFTEIRASSSERARVYSRVPINYYLVARGSRGDWRGVIMANGQIGWVPKNYLKETGYDVVYHLPRDVQNPEHVLQLAQRYLGARYRWGGNNPDTGIDCSAFVKLVYAQMGVGLPRTAREQAKVGMPITRTEHLKPGDRLYFQVKRSYIDHTGIYIGEGYFIHSSVSRGGVAIDHLSRPLYARSLVSARR